MKRPTVAFSRSRSQTLSAGGAQIAVAPTPLGGVATGVPGVWGNQPSSLLKSCFVA